MKKTNTWYLLAKLVLFFILNSVNVSIAIVGISYLQPDFTRGYLAGQTALFESTWFPLGLYVHAFTAPIGLLIVSLLVLFRIERFPSVHRLMGKIALVLLLFAIVPSGWVLSYYAMGGVVGKLIFFLLSSYTAFAAIQGYTAIRQKNTLIHQHWMYEVLALLASAILLRLLLSLFHEGFDFYGNWSYNSAALLSWVPSILVLKMMKTKGIQ